MNIRIYQVDMDRDSEKHNVAFLGYDSLTRFQGSQDIDSSIYNKVFEGDVDCKDLEDVYEMFNFHHPKGYTGRSLSKSDVVEVIGETSTFHYCDTFGFQDVDFDPSLAQEKLTAKIKVIMLEPGKQAATAQIMDDFEVIKEAVGGPIEIIKPYDDDVIIVVNRNAKEDGLPFNRAVYSEPSEKEMTYTEMTELFRQKESENDGKHIVGYVVFSQDNFTKEYSEKSRTYEISSNNKAFQQGMGGYSIFASCLDGTDPCVRLDGYIRCEKPWKIERCYTIDNDRILVDTIDGKAMICGFSGEEFVSLSDEQVKKYMDKFKYPERFANVNGKCVALPIKNTKELDER